METISKLIGYFLRGTNQEYILVFKAGDPEDIRRIITRLCKSRDKDLRVLGEQLQTNWYERHK